MTDNEIRQRVKYLVEHGGIYEDPQDDIRRKVTCHRMLTVLGLVIVSIDLILTIMQL